MRLKALVDDGRNVFLCVCQPDKPVGRKHIITPPPSKLYALEAGIKVFQPSTFKDGEAFEYISKLKTRFNCNSRIWKDFPSVHWIFTQMVQLMSMLLYSPKYRSCSSSAFHIGMAIRLLELQ